MVFVPINANAQSTNAALPEGKGKQEVEAVCLTRPAGATQ
tara:strand:+ start:3458 stop:3577 length:120 start_codon:yes stop_codon:yes gene_type:complete